MKHDRIAPVDKPESEAAPKAPSTVIMSFRMAPEAHAALLQQAQAADMTPRSWLESTVLKFPAARIVRRKKEQPDQRALLFQINRVGNNINQIARKLNTLDKAGTLRSGAVDEGIQAWREANTLLQKALSYAR